MLVTQGGRFDGWALYVLNGKPIYTYNLANLERYNIEGEVLTPGSHTIRYDFEYDGGGAGKGGNGKLYVDDVLVGERRVDQTIGYRISLDETFDMG